MHIGNVYIEHPVFLAPMAGVTDQPFRRICRELGCGLVYSEMISAKGLLYESENTRKLMAVHPDERPVAVQLFGSEPDIMGRMAKKIENEPFDILDINMGCPAPKIVKNGEGSALMKDPAKVGEIVAAMVQSQNKPVTVKIRKGYDDNTLTAIECAKQAEKNGAAAVAVHGRTREQFYSGKADWNIIQEVKAAVGIPVIGNGDVNSPEDAVAMFQQTGCDAVMIGRGAQGNPWIFARVARYLKTGELLPEPTIDERIAMAICHAQMLIDYKGEYTGVREMRRHMSYYLKGVPGASAIRGQLNAAESLLDMEMLLPY